MDTHSKLINKLGGTAAVARFLKVPANYVSKWRRRGIPWHHRFAVSQLAAEYEVNLPEEFLNENPWH